jgi:hypothetical protein
MSNAIFLILLASIVVLGIINTKQLGRSDKRLERNLDIMERHIALMEKESENDNNDNGIQG